MLIEISIHALRKEGDPRCQRIHDRRQCISIHALRKEGDDHHPPHGWQSERDFYPRPPQGGRLKDPKPWIDPAKISIHALRKEGDLGTVDDADFLKVFLSTPSARRATRATAAVMGACGISIHALRKEGDSKNGEKHLRFCFIIKRSAQIWKSLSKNIRKNSCDLHKTA